MEETLFLVFFCGDGHQIVVFMLMCDLQLFVSAVSSGSQSQRARRRAAAAAVSSSGGRQHQASSGGGQRRRPATDIL